MAGGVHPGVNVAGVDRGHSLGRDEWEGAQGAAGVTRSLWWGHCGISPASLWGLGKGCCRGCLGIPMRGSLWTSHRKTTRAQGSMAASVWPSCQGGLSSTQRRGEAGPSDIPGDPPQAHGFWSPHSILGSSPSPGVLSPLLESSCHSWGPHPLLGSSPHSWGPLPTPGVLMTLLGSSS